MASQSLTRGFGRISTPFLSIRAIGIQQAPRTFATSAFRMTATTISDAIKKDHAELKEHYDQIVNSTDLDTKIRHQNAFVWELARHSIGEEIVVYPLFEKHLPDGKAMADKDRDEHNQVKVELKKFQNLHPEDSTFEPTLKSLWETLSQHIKEEESSDLPKLEDSISREDSQKTAKSFGRTKMLVPTRSHPSAPDKPPFETVAGLMAAPLDKIQDIFRRFPE